MLATTFGTVQKRWSDEYPCGLKKMGSKGTKKNQKETELELEPQRWGTK